MYDPPHSPALSVGGDSQARRVCFQVETGDLKAMIMYFVSNEPYTDAYGTSRKFDVKVSDWLKGELHSAPSELKNAFFVSDFEFYALQDAIGDRARAMSGRPHGRLMSPALPPSVAAVSRRERGEAVGVPVRKHRGGGAAVHDRIQPRPHTDGWTMHFGHRDEHRRRARVGRLGPIGRRRRLLRAHQQA
jgi:hypothetical protein